MAVISVQVLSSGINATVQSTQMNTTSQPASLIFINTTDDSDTVTTAGYLNQSKQLYGNVYINDALAIVYTTDKGQSPYQISISGQDISLIPEINPGSVDLPVTANHIACFTDTAGTIGDDVTTAINAGNIQAGVSGTQGTFVSYPATAGKGTFIVAATDSTSAYNTTLTNNALGQTTVFHLPDPSASAAGVLVSTLTAPDNNSNFVTFDVTVGHAALAAGGEVVLYQSSGTKRYKVRGLWINDGGTDFAGGGGDRALRITDTTTFYATINAALLQSLDNATVGNTNFPFGTAAFNTSTVAGASLVAKYNGGTNDYTTGSVVISGLLERVA